VLLHPSPISGAMLVPLATALARTRPVVVFDSPGYGDSTPLPGEPGIADFARAVAAGIDSLELGEIDLYGANTGACIAAETALADPSRIHALVLDNPPIFDDELRQELVERLCPPFVIRDDGLQLVAAWSFIRDHAMWFPPYRRDPEHVRPGSRRRARSCRVQRSGNGLRRRRPMRRRWQLSSMRANEPTGTRALRSWDGHHTAAGATRRRISAAR
jgi:pimeloyl-ACP methyl ester carboxylesterase